MNPLLLSALLSFAPGFLSRLFGGDSNARLRREVKRLTNPLNVGRVTNQFYQQSLGSPAYQQALGTIAAGANAASSNLAGALGARGLGTTGTGAVLSSLTPSLIGSQRAGLTSAAYQGAQSQAQQSIEAQLRALMGTQGPSYSGQLYGAGLSAFAPMLQAWLQSQLKGGSVGGGYNPYLPAGGSLPVYLP